MTIAACLLSAAWPARAQEYPAGMIYLSRGCKCLDQPTQLVLKGLIVGNSLFIQYKQVNFKAARLPVAVRQ